MGHGNYQMENINAEAKPKVSDRYYKLYLTGRLVVEVMKECERQNPNPMLVANYELLEVMLNRSQEADNVEQGRP